MLIVLRPEIAKCEMTMALHQSPDNFPLIPKQNGAVRMNHDPHAHSHSQNPEREGSRRQHVWQELGGEPPGPDWLKDNGQSDQYTALALPENSCQGCAS